jgi:hypothetical protein
LLIVVGYAAYRYWDGTRLVPKGYILTIASDGLPLSAIQRIDLTDGSLVSLSTEGQGTAVIIDAVQNESVSHFLIASPDFRTANLYRQDRSNTTAGLKELTHSQTAKFDLSYDELSGVAAYASVPEAGGAAHITVWSPLTKKETDLGVGRHPVLLPGGFFVVLERDGKVMSVNVETGDAYELLTLAPESTYAVDAQNMRVALSVPAIEAIQTFSIANSVSASFESDLHAPSAPTEMAFFDGELVTAAADTGTGEFVLSRNGQESRVTPAAPLPDAYKFTLLHD